MWIDDLGEHKPAAACCLCRRHADTLTPPRNWELRDLRSKAQSPVEQSPVERSTLVTIPNEPPPVPEPASAPVAAAVAAEGSPDWSPRLFASVDTGSVLDATSPLLSRAFHGVR